MATEELMSRAATSREMVMAAPTNTIPSPCGSEKLYVAVGEKVKQSKSVLRWALQNSGGRSICILHVHQPPRTVPVLGGRFLSTAIEEKEVRAYQRVKLEEMKGTLDKYLSICLQFGVRGAEKLYIEKEEGIEEGILELIRKHNITRLVMGAAADTHYSSSMMDIRSTKAITVSLKAPSSCHISFVCNGFLVHLREGVSEEINGELRSLLHRGISTPAAMDSGESSQFFRSRTVPSSVQPPYTKLTNPVQDILRRVQSLHPIISGRKSAATVNSPSTTRSTPTTTTSTTRAVANTSSTDLDTSFIDLDFRSTTTGSSTTTTTFSSPLSSCSSAGAVSRTTAEESNEANMELILLPPEHDGVSDNVEMDDDEDDLTEAMEECIRSRREAVDEAVRRVKSEEKAFEDLLSLRNKALREAEKRAQAQKSAAEALHVARALEDVLAEESSKRKEAEEKLGKKEEEVKKMQGDAMTNQLVATDSDHKIVSAVELLQRYKKEMEELRAERDELLREAEEVRRNRLQGRGGIRSSITSTFPEFSGLEIKEATNDLDPALKIGEGGFGSIYKAELRCTKVAIKVLDPHGLQGPSEFQKEVDILSKIRHPNLVTLIGACPESNSLVYEYLPNGSLEDKLSCKHMSSGAAMSWQTRIRIATELCSVLIFLHSNKPDSIVHGDIKPSNILLDANLVIKLSDFGIARLLRDHDDDDDGDDNMTVFWRTDPKGTPFYMDPEFFSTGKLTAKSDVYSFGVILLRLLTGRPARGITSEVRYAISSGRVGSLLDPLAGEWPASEAKELAELGVRCCEVSGRNRPDLASGVWKVLKSMEEVIYF